MKIAVFLLAVALIACLLWRGGSGPIVDPGRDAHIDSAPGVQRMDSAALAHADTAIARAARDSSVTKLADSAKRMGARLDSLDRLAARLQRTNRARKDSIAALATQVDSMTGNVAPDVLDTLTVTEELAGDSALSCESRYAGRIQQLSLLGDALERCRARGDTVRAALVGVRDTLAISRTYLAASDSLLKWEVTRPRPCQVDLWVKKVGCGTAMLGTAVVSFVGGMVARRH